ncbi:MAG: glycosyltransferase family 4 protein [Pyrinomonadaceae bacterium]
MKVLHILDTLSRGGIAMLELDVCRNAAANNLDLTFVATGGGDLENDFRASGVEFIRLHRRYPVDLKIVAALRKIIRAREIEVVHAHQAVEALHAYFATRGTNVKCVLSFHGCTFDARNRLALKFLIPRMAANVAVSRGYLARLETTERLDTSRNFRVIHNGVDTKRLQRTKRNLRGELGLSDGVLLLGMVGNFYPGVRKDQLTICRALPRLFAAAPHAHFVFVGGRSEIAPELYDDCVNYCREQGIDGRVHFMGKRADVADVLSSLDVFVFSSLEDTFGIAVVEAMAMGLPTIASDIPPLMEVIGDGEYALNFRTQDAEDLARKLTPLLANSTARAQLGAKAEAWALQQFGINAYISRLTELYEELTGAA